MIDDETVALLEGGGALLVGTVGDDGAPHATRGWGADVLARSPLRIRLLVDGDDERAVAQLALGHRVAVTAADVATLRSVQLKGSVVGAPRPDARGWDRAKRYASAFYDDIVATDGTPRAVLERLTPVRFAVVEVEVAEVFDQTPGPSAGGAVEAQP